MADVNIQPIGERVLVEVKEVETVTASGIILPDSATEKPLQATVLAIGGGVKDDAIKVGAQVMYGKYAGTEIEHQGQTYLVLNESDILATF